MEERRYVITGLDSPGAKITLSGTVFFMKNPFDRNYHLEHVRFRNGELQMDFRPNPGIDIGSTKAPYYYLSMRPSCEDQVGLRICDIQQVDESTAKIEVYKISSICEEGKDYFRVQKSSGDLPAEVVRSGIATKEKFLNDSEEMLVKGIDFLKLF